MKYRRKNAGLGVFGLFTLSRFCVIVPITTFKLKRNGYKKVMQNLPTGSLLRWLPSASSDKRILRACKLALDKIERGSPFPGTCLSRSLVLWSTLQRYGIDADLRIGIKNSGNTLYRDTSAFAAHAWVEVNGIPLNAPGDISTIYTPFSHDITKQNVDKLPFTS